MFNVVRSKSSSSRLYKVIVLSTLKADKACKRFGIGMYYMLSNLDLD